MKRNCLSSLAVVLPILGAVAFTSQSAYAEKSPPKPVPPAARMDDDADDRDAGPDDRMGDEDRGGPPGRMDDGDWAGRPGDRDMDGPRGPRDRNQPGGPRGYGDQRGQARPMGGDGGGTAITVAGAFVYVVKGNTLYQFAISDLHLMRQAQLAPSGPPERRLMGDRTMGDRPMGERPMGDRAPGDRPQRPID